MVGVGSSSGSTREKCTDTQSQNGENWKKKMEENWKKDECEKKREERRGFIG